MKHRVNRRLAVFVFGVGLITGPAKAHDPSKHKGKATKGEIVALTVDRLQLKTAKGNVTVLLTEKPKIEVGEAEASAEALKKGQQATVIGTTLASDEIVAREIIVTDTKGDKNGHPPSKGSAHGH